MIEELKVLSKVSQFKIVFLRQPADFYKDDLELLSNNGVEIVIAPFNRTLDLSKIFFALNFFFTNINSFTQPYSFVIGIKSVLWFLMLDISIFKNSNNIHAQFATQCSIISMMLKKHLNNKIGYSFTFHAHDIYFKNKWFTKLVSESELVFSISKYNIEYVIANYAGLNKDKLMLSRLGALPPSKDSRSVAVEYDGEKALKIGLISWFVPKKGIQYLLEAVKILKERNFPIILILAGDGPEKQRILDYISENNLQNEVKYIGKVYGDEKTEFFQSLNSFILPAINVPNDKDGIPVVLMEAISFNLPIISTDVSGIPEICLNDFNGYLVEEKNATALADAIQKISNKETYERFKLNSSTVFKDYDIVKNTNYKAKNMNWA